MPAVGGDTLFSDMGAAYDNLPEAVKEQIASLTAIHSFAASFGRLLSPDDLEAKRAEFPDIEHPVVRTHPETGRKTLFVNRIFTSHIVGLEPEASHRLLERLYAEAAVPEYQCRFHWTADAVVFWDNRSVQHYACSDYWPQRRVMERVTIVGDRPY